MSDIGASNEGDIRREQLRRAGELLFGGNGARLASSLGCSVDLVSKILTGKRSVSDAMKVQLIEMCVAQSIELSRRAAEAAALGHKIAGTAPGYLKALAVAEEEQEEEANRALAEYNEGRYGKDWRRSGEGI